MHIVVVPKRHVASLLELDDDELVLDLIDAVREMAESVGAAKGGRHIATNPGKY